MADTGKQDPLGINVLGSVLNEQGLTINPIVTDYVGTSTDNYSYTPGKIVNDTALKLLSYSINHAYIASDIDNGTFVTVNAATYTNLISIGLSPNQTVPALGLAKSPGYDVTDPSGVWTTQAVEAATSAGFLSPLPGPATSGFPVTGVTYQGQYATWYPYNLTNPNMSITQWGFLHCFSLQAFNEFNYNNPDPTSDHYADFVGSFQSADGFINATNRSINTVNNSKDFLQGTFSNMNDLITGDVTGVSLATQAFGSDLINLGSVINLSKLDTFGLPSVLLQTLFTFNAITEELNLAMLSNGLEFTDVLGIVNGTIVPTPLQESQIYSSFLLVQGANLEQVLIPLNCKTKNLDSLADLLNVKKMFPNSYTTLTVPVYNTEPGPTNSKTYYPIYKNQDVNPAITAPSVATTVGTQLPQGSPPLNTPNVPSPTTLDADINTRPIRPQTIQDRVGGKRDFRDLL
jgi:hypothetical protein